MAARAPATKRWPREPAWPRRIARCRRGHDQRHGAGLARPAARCRRPSSWYSISSTGIVWIAGTDAMAQAWERGDNLFLLPLVAGVHHLEALGLAGVADLDDAAEVAIQALAPCVGDAGPGASAVPSLSELTKAKSLVNGCDSTDNYCFGSRICSSHSRILPRLRCADPGSDALINGGL